MPFSFEIDEDLDLLIIEAEGELTITGLKACVQGYMSDPSFHPGIDALIELGEDITVKIGDNAVQVVALVRDGGLQGVRSLLAEVNKGQEFKMACVGGSTKGRTFFMAGMGLVAFDGDYRAFEERSAALEWLGRERDVIRARR